MSLRLASRVFLSCLTAVLWTSLLVSNCFAIIFGGEGNKPLPDPGWPKGAAEVFNWKTRIAYWEGPPFGGGQWHAESKGNAEEVNRVLQAFEKIEAKQKRVVLKSGIGYSFWLDPNRDRRHDKKTKIDWEFTVWVPKSWDFQKTLPADMSAISGEQGEEPVPVLTIYTSFVDREKLELPKSLSIEDNTLEGHGFSKKDGRVLQGRVVDAKSQEPIAAKIRFETISRNPNGGYTYEQSEALKTNANGEWTKRNVTRKWSRIIVEAEGYASRIVSHIRYDSQPGWAFLGSTLSNSASLAGKVVDEQGEPLAGVRVRLSGVTVDDTGDYKTALTEAKTNDDGLFEFSEAPQGEGKLTVYKPGLNGPPLGKKVSIPAKDLTVKMTQAAEFTVKVKFPNGKVAENYIVNVEPVGGNKVGTWGGSATLDGNNSYHFKNVPPGSYNLVVRPNPGSSKSTTEPVKVELKGGDSKTVEVTYK